MKNAMGNKSVSYTTKQPQTCYNKLVIYLRMKPTKMKEKTFPLTKFCDSNITYHYKSIQ